MKRFFAGLDWGGERHAICVVDDAGTRVVEFEVTHDADGLASMLKQPGKVAPSADMAVAIERPSGPVVDTLVGAGHSVVPVHPNVVKAFRPRVAMANQLRSLLESFWPGAVALFADIDSPIALAFVRRYPTPQSAALLGEKRLASFLAQERYSGRRPVSDLLSRLRAAPAAVCSEVEAKGELVKALARILGTLVVEIAKLTSRIEHDVQQLAVGKIVMSFPRTGKRNTYAPDLHGAANKLAAA